MTSLIESGTELILAGYVRLAENGFALPIFASAAGANTSYVATCSIPGEPGGVIAGFEQFEPETLETLPETQTRPVWIGSPWVDVGVVQVRVTPKTKNPFTIKALSISGVT